MAYFPGRTVRFREGKGGDIDKIYLPDGSRDNWVHP